MACTTCRSTSVRVMFTILVALIPRAAAGSPLAYALGTWSGSISVIDLATDAVVSTIPTAVESYHIVLTPDGTKGFVTNYQSKAVSVIDTAGGSISSTLPLSERPFGIAVTPDGTTAYVVGTDTGGAPGSGTNHLFAIDIATNSISGPYPSGGELNPPITPDSTNIVIGPDGRAYIANRFSHTVSVFDTTTNMVVDSIPIEYAPGEPGVPVSIAINPTGTKVYVGNVRAGADIDPGADNGPAVLWVVDTATNSVVNTITIADPLARAVPGIVFGSDGTRAYASLRDHSYRVAIIDATTDSVLGETDTITEVPCSDSAGGCLGDIAIAPDHTKVYVTLGASPGYGAIAVVPLARASGTTVTSYAGNGQALLAMPRTTSPPSPQPISGRKLRLKDSSDSPHRTLVVDSRDAGIGLGAGNGSLDDPAAGNASSIRLRTNAGCNGPCDIAVSLGGSWTYVGRAGLNRGYKYRDKVGVVRSCMIKGGRLTLNARGALLPSLGSDPRPVDILLRMGSKLYCMQFGGAATLVPNRSLVARDAAPLLECPP